MNKRSAVAEAERAVLGSLIRDNRAIPKVAVMLTSEDFYSDPHQKIYAGILGLFDRGRPVDTVTLAALLHAKNQIADVTYPYLGELWDAAPTSANAMYYAEIVRDNATFRAVLLAGQEIAALAADPAQSADELLNDVEQRIFAISNRRRRSEVVTLRQAIREAYDRLDMMHQRAGGPTTGVATGLIDLDEYTGGLQDGELVVIAARPSLGKTTLGMRLAFEAAVSGCAVFVVSLEQSRTDLALRMICAEGKIDHQRARKGKLEPSDRERFQAIGSELQQLPIFIDDGSPQSMLASPLMPDD
jgi:replicative DNA helicase